MNKNAATVPGDLPMRIIAKFAGDLALPLSHLINTGFKAGQYPQEEVVTPVTKVSSW